MYSRTRRQSVNIFLIDMEWPPSLNRNFYFSSFCRGKNISLSWPYLMKDTGSKREWIWSFTCSPWNLSLKTKVRLYRLLNRVYLFSEFRGNERMAQLLTMWCFQNQACHLPLNKLAAFKDPLWKRKMSFTDIKLD